MPERNGLDKKGTEGLTGSDYRWAVAMWFGWWTGCWFVAFQVHDSPVVGLAGYPILFGVAMTLTWWIGDSTGGSEGLKPSTPSSWVTRLKVVGIWVAAVELFWVLAYLGRPLVILGWALAVALAVVVTLVLVVVGIAVVAFNVSSSEAPAGVVAAGSVLGAAATAGGMVLIVDLVGGSTSKWVLLAAVLLGIVLGSFTPTHSDSYSMLVLQQLLLTAAMAAAWVVTDVMFAVVPGSGYPAVCGPAAALAVAGVWVRAERDRAKHAKRVCVAVLTIPFVALLAGIGAQIAQGPEAGLATVAFVAACGAMIFWPPDMWSPARP